jgi:hypothetical protein
MDKKSVLCLSLAVSFILLCVLIAGCTATTGSVVGEYRGYASEERNSLVIYEDGNYRSPIPSEEGTWTVEGNTLILTHKVIDHYEPPSGGYGQPMGSWGGWVYKDENRRYEIIGNHLKTSQSSNLGGFAKEYVKEK